MVQAVYRAVLRVLDRWICSMEVVSAPEHLGAEWRFDRHDNTAYLKVVQDATSEAKKQCHHYDVGLPFDAVRPNILLLGLGDKDYGTVPRSALEYFFTPGCPALGT